MPDRASPGSGWGDGAWAAGGIRTLVGCLVAFQLLLALVNLPLMYSDQRENEHVAMQEAAGRPLAAPAAVTPPMLRSTVAFLKRQVDLDREDNLATWFPTVQLAVLGFAALLLRLVRRRAGWLWIGLGFLYLSADEMAQIHEWVGVRLDALGWHLGAMHAPYAWVLLLGPLFLGFALWMIRFVWRETRAELRLRGVSIVAVALLILVLPVELIGGHLQGTLFHPPRIEVIIEETLETMGETLLIGVFLTLASRELALRRPASSGAEAAADLEAHGAGARVA